MELKKIITKKVAKERLGLASLTKNSIIHSQELQEDGTYLVTLTRYSNLPYEQLVHKLVREKYTESEEFAILRKALNEKTDEFLTYNAYVEECKVRAKEFIAEREKALNN